MQSVSNTDFVDEFALPGGGAGRFYSLPRLGARGYGDLGRLPVSLRVVLESVLRNLDGKRVGEAALRAVAGWQPRAERTEEVPFTVARVLLQDFTGVPLVVDLAAMRGAVTAMGRNAGIVAPQVPVDLVIDHSVQVDYYGMAGALRLNMEIEFRRNLERYRFLKWGQNAFQGFRVVPPGVGICHQVNLEFLARGVIEKDGVYYPDTLVGTDSHTTMINGLGVLGWGVGGIEAEAAMLGEPVYFLLPDVVGVHLKGALPAGTTATDLVLAVTEMLRKAKVVGKFVEFHGEGAAALALTDRATIANMAPEYGATAGFFPVDDATLAYLRATGRSEAQVETVKRYYQAQGLFGVPAAGQCDYSQLLELDLAGIRPAVAGPKRPQDRIDLYALKQKFHDLMTRSDATGYNKAADVDKRVAVTLHAVPARHMSGGGSQSSPPTASEVQSTSVLTEREMVDNRPTPDRVTPPSAVAVDVTLGHGAVAIAAITSCTNTSNPAVMLAAGLVARKAVARGLNVPAHVKTSLAPGSRMVSEYLAKTGLQEPLDALGFQTVGYGCTTCIGNSGPLDPGMEKAIADGDLVLASVLSGNRNFEARVHQSIRANFLMSPPLVVAFALAGRVDIDLAAEPLGTGSDGAPVFLRDLWPSPAEVEALLGSALDAAAYRRLYSAEAQSDPLWDKVSGGSGELYAWEPDSTYIRLPPYFDPHMAGSEPKDITGARALAIFGDSVTTDHISPAGSIKPSSPAGQYLLAHGVPKDDFNSYGARRGNHEVMVRGTFANVRIKNLMLPGTEGGLTVHQPGGAKLPIYDAAMKYEAEGVPLMVFAGQEYGTGSSRDWAAKGTRLLGVKVLVAQSFERIHRSNLVGMGVLPCQFAEGESAQTLGLRGDETFDLKGIAGSITPRQKATLVIHLPDGSTRETEVTVRIDTPIEVDYYRSGGILPYVLRQIVSRA